MEKNGFVESVGTCGDIFKGNIYTSPMSKISTHFYTTMATTTAVGVSAVSTCLFIFVILSFS